MPLSMSQSIALPLVVLEYRVFNLQCIVTFCLQHLVVGNGGLGNNVQYEQLYHLFSPHGSLLDIRMIPRKPYAFVSFGTPEEAQRACAAVHGETIQKDSLTDSPQAKLYLAYVANGRLFHSPHSG